MRSIFKWGQRGHIHFVMPILAIVAVAGIGAAYLAATHAATVPGACATNTGTFTSTTATAKVPYNKDGTGSDGKQYQCVQYINQMLNGVNAYQVLHKVHYSSGSLSGKYVLVNGQFGKVPTVYNQDTTGQVKLLQTAVNLPNTTKVLKPKGNLPTNGSVGTATWYALCYYQLHGVPSSDRQTNNATDYKNGNPSSGKTSTWYTRSYLRAAHTAALSAGCAKALGTTSGGTVTPPSPTPTPTPTPTPAPTPTPSSKISCNYQTDTWSGDASGVGYTVSTVGNPKNGNPASFSVKLNAKKGTTEVVGYPSDQCLLYSALPAKLASSYNVTPPASSSGLDYEYAYDIWLTTKALATAAGSPNQWSGSLELMIWTYNNGQTPAGSVKGTLSDGSKVWIDGNNSDGIVSVVLPKNATSGTVDIASIISQLKSKGYINASRDGILDVEYGIEAPYGGGQTFAVNALSVAE